MDKTTKLNILYDYYGNLLTKPEQSHFEDYYFHNLTLAEIATNNNLSRNAVHKAIKSSELKLNTYEDKLKLFYKNNQIKQVIKDKELLNQLEDLI